MHSILLIKGQRNRVIQHQDSVISYETAIKANSEFYLKELTIDENSEFFLPTYDEALKMKGKGPSDSQG